MMTPQRFAQIVDAHGAAPHRWPDAERASAGAFVLAEPEIAASILRAARALDTIMDAYRTAEPMEALQARILAALPVNDWRRWTAPLAAGLAAACAAGVLLGANLSRSATADARTDAAIAAMLSDDGTAAALTDGERG